MKIFDIKWTINTAGPSPYSNLRTELFLFGCNKAMSGNPCKNCFNTRLWDNSCVEIEHDPLDVADTIDKFTTYKYITISGGEPLDQIDELIPLCQQLKKYRFNIMIYTWRNIKDIIECKEESLYGINKEQLLTLLNYVDIIVDGEYNDNDRLYDEKAADGFLSSIGSGNQIIWDINNRYGYLMKHLKSIKLDNNNLIFDLIDKETQKILL